MPPKKVPDEEKGAEADAQPAAAALPSRKDIGSIKPFDVTKGKDWPIYWERLALFFKVNGYPTHGETSHLSLRPTIRTDH